MKTTNFSIKNLREEDVLSPLDNEIRHLLCVCFPNDEAHFRQTRYWNEHKPAFVITLNSDAELVGHVSLVELSVSVGTYCLSVAALGCFAVKPTHQGRGLASNLLNAFRNLSLEEKFDLGLLLCLPELEKVYAKAGWITLQDRTLSLKTENNAIEEYHGKNIAMWLPLVRTSLPEGDISINKKEW